MAVVGGDSQFGLRPPPDAGGFGGDREAGGASKDAFARLVSRLGGDASLFGSNRLPGGAGLGAKVGPDGKGSLQPPAKQPPATQPPPKQPPANLSPGSAEKSPTVSEFEMASESLSVFGSGGAGNLKPLTDANGNPVERQLPSGMVAKAFVTPENQIIIAFGGTGSGASTNPGGIFGQIISDVIGGEGGVSPAQRDAADFTKEVQALAQQKGYGKGDVFVTGHSLGGMEAQYAAAQTGVGGMSFESPGSTKGLNPVGDGSNFVNVVDQSDPIANIDFAGRYGKEFDVNTGLGLAAHLQGSQASLLPENESLLDFARSL